MATLTSLLAQQASIGVHYQNVITASNATWAVPTGVTLIDALLVGGGGSGGSGQSASSGWNYAATGGGGGQSVRVTFATTPGETLNLTIGAGGVAPTNLNGYPGVGGGNTSIVRNLNSAQIALAYGGVGGGYTYSNITYAPTNNVSNRRQTMSGNTPGMGAAASGPDTDDVDGWGGAGTAGCYASNQIYPGMPGVGGGMGACYGYWNGQNGAPNTGGGGGGAMGYYNSTGQYAGSGGSGVIILDYDVVS